MIDGKEKFTVEELKKIYTDIARTKKTDKSVRYISKNQNPENKQKTDEKHTKLSHDFILDELSSIKNDMKKVVSDIEKLKSKEPRIQPKKLIPGELAESLAFTLMD